MSIVIAVVIFGLIIAIHEFGHCIAAKLCGVRVNEFSIGMGPAILKKQKGETLYSLRLLPIGGFCALEGEDTDSDDSRAFSNKKIWQKILILAAGAIMNIILGFIIIVITVCMSKYITSTTVAEFYDGATSCNSGLQVGDRIVSVNGLNIFIDGDISYQFAKDEDGIFEMEVIRNGERVKLDNVTFQLAQDDTIGRRIVIDFSVEPIKKNPITVLQYSCQKTAYVSRIVILSLIDIINGTYKINDLSGPVGIVSAIGSVISPTEKFVNNLRTVLSLATFITINVGIFNLLPLPALDGGRIVFRIIEAVIRKKIKPSVEGAIHFFGLAALMLLMVFVTYNDIVKIIINR